jgi:hypothetical protein
MALFGKTNTAAPVPRRDEIFTPHTIAGFPRGIFNGAVNRIFSWPGQGPTGVNHAFRQIVARGRTLCFGQVVACSAGKSAEGRHRNRKIHQHRFRHQPAIESTIVGDATKLSCSGAGPTQWGRIMGGSASWVLILSPLFLFD